MKADLDKIFADREKAISEQALEKEQQNQLKTQKANTAKSVFRTAIIPTLNELSAELVSRGYSSKSGFNEGFILPQATLSLLIPSTDRSRSYPESTLTFKYLETEFVVVSYEIWGPKGKSISNSTLRENKHISKVDSEWVKNSALSFVKKLTTQF